MKLKKKTAMLVSFAVGTLLFASTALAEIATKSGYDQIKDSLKITAEKLTDGSVSSYTMDMSMAIKDNGKVISSESKVEKFDVTKKAQMTNTTSTNGSNKSENFFYRDKDSYINYDSNRDVYYVTEFQGSDKANGDFLSNPFKQKEAGDIERIIDAFVGNLKDYVVVSEASDGSKELSGSLNESQIPALVNAIVSFQFKNSYGYRVNPESNMPAVTKDIFVKEVNGKMVVDKNGMVQSVLGTGTLVGKDDKGTEHNLTFELLEKITNINKTSVTKPDLTGKNVEKSVANKEPGLSNPQMYLGSYKNNIVIQKDGKFVKIGERFVDITQIDDKTVTGKYHEVYAKGYEDYSGQTKEFSFSGSFEKGGFDAIINPSEDEAKRGHISINPYSAKVYFGINSMESKGPNYDGQFDRVFE